MTARYAIEKRYREALGNPRCSLKCMLYHIFVEYIAHVISSGPKLSSYYLTTRHDVVAKTISNVIRKKDCPRINIEKLLVVEYIHKHQHKEYWRKIFIKTTIKYKHKCRILLFGKEGGNMHHHRNQLSY